MIRTIHMVKMINIRYVSLFILTWITVYRGVSCMPSSVERTGRNLWQLSNMIQCTTERSGYHDFNGYGCWCRSGGQGTPVDDIDRCCQAHDQCYDRWDSSQSGCWLGAKATTYDYRCSRGSITCTDPSNTCDYDLCVCDKRFAECIRYKSYNIEYSPGHMDDRLCDRKRLLDLFLNELAHEPSVNEFENAEN